MERPPSANRSLRMNDLTLRVFFLFFLEPAGFAPARSLAPMMIAELPLASDEEPVPIGLDAEPEPEPEVEERPVAELEAALSAVGGTPNVTVRVPLTGDVVVAGGRIPTFAPMFMFIISVASVAAVVWGDRGEPRVTTSMTPWWQ